MYRKVVNFMDTSTLLQIIGSYCFPIVACVFMGWYIKYTTDKHREEITRLNEQHKTEMESVTEAIHNLNVVTEKLYERIGDFINERTDK